LGYVQIPYTSGAGYRDNASIPSIPVVSKPVEYGWR